jgi:hypothetical protein
VKARDTNILAEASYKFIVMHPSLIGARCNKINLIIPMTPGDTPEDTSHAQTSQGFQRAYVLFLREEIIEADVLLAGRVIRPRLTISHKIPQGSA